MLTTETELYQDTMTWIEMKRFGGTSWTQTIGNNIAKFRKERA